jgi:ABC-type transporter Mla subunit MlaD
MGTRYAVVVEAERRERGEAMGFLDRFRKKASAVVDEQGDKIGAGLDKAADFVDDRTGHKYSGKIDAGVDEAKDALDSLDGKNDDIADTAEDAAPSQARPS